MQTISTDKLMNMKNRDEDFVLINTLNEDQFDKTRIPGSVNIPQSRKDFVQRVEQQTGDKDATVVVYCANPECDSSSQAAHKLEKAGFSNVMDLEAGAEGWQQAGNGLAAG
jgi:rhodanese-related sulfurtransferase